MTRKHFEAIAAAIRAEMEATHSAEGKEAIRATAVRLARVFSAENARFDTSRFFAACGVI